jgi:hypothetical protein
MPFRGLPESSDAGWVMLYESFGRTFVNNFVQALTSKRSCPAYADLICSCLTTATADAVALRTDRESARDHH